MALLSCFTYLTTHPCLGNIDSGLVRSTFVGFSRKKGKVFGSWSILQFFDVRIIDTEAKLVELFLHVFYNLEIG